MTAALIAVPLAVCITLATDVNLWGSAAIGIACGLLVPTIRRMAK